MNILKVNEMVYKFQDLVERKKVKTFAKFQNEIYLNFIIFDENHKSYKFISYELKKMHTFLKEVQHHPNSHLLAQALKPMFEMLVNSIIIPKVVSVMEEKSGGVVPIRYIDLISASSKKKIIRKTCGFFVVPYRGKDAVKNKLIKISSKPGWLSVLMADKIFENLIRSPNPLLVAELSEIMSTLISESEDGFIDTTNKKVIQASEKLLEFYLELDD